MISVAVDSSFAGFSVNFRRAGRRFRLPGVLGTFAWLAMALGAPAEGWAQASDSLVVLGPDDSSLSLPVGRSRGYATVPHGALRQLGWTIEVDLPLLRARLGPDGPVVEFSLDSPLFRWDDELLQLVSAPFSRGGSVHIPLQFVVDFLPVRASEAYAFSPDQGALEILNAALWPEDDERTARVGTDLSGIGGLAAPTLGQDLDGQGLDGQDLDEAQDLLKRVVVIDPGHGGGDPGTTGSGGRREKDIALAIGRYLQRELRGEEDFEVYMTRDRDELVPLWERGPRATQWKGDRFGVFISIHVNSSSTSPAVRGFETYFLSEARTEHEERVVAIENAPIQGDAEVDRNEVEELDLDFIRRDLVKFDHQHWSSLLAEGIQAELEDVHPGPNRGVKQGEFAVITNVLMPAVLVEVGFISNREEERVLSRGEFQREVAVALADGVRGFFERYPPGQGVAVEAPLR